MLSNQDAQTIAPILLRHHQNTYQNDASENSTINIHAHPFNVNHIRFSGKCKSSAEYDDDDDPALSYQLPLADSLRI